MLVGIMSVSLDAKKQTSAQCCICKEDFPSDDELANHLLEHTEESTFANAIKEAKKDSAPVNSSSTVQTFNRKRPLNGPDARKNISGRPASPEVWEIISDEEDYSPSPLKTPSKVQNISSASNTPTKLSNAKLVSGGSSASNTPTKLNNVPITPPNGSVIPMRTQNTLTATNGQAFFCSICCRVFSDAAALNSHKATAHAKKDNFVCQICYKSFSYKCTLRQHLFLHIREKEHICNICKKGFSLKNQLRKHQYESHSGSFPMP